MRWLLLLALATPAFAANPKATALAKEGDRLYREGKYREAAESLKQAYDLDKNPVLLFNIARAYDQAGDLQIALDTYRQYIGLPDTDPQLVKRANLNMDRLRVLIARTDADKAVQEAESKRLKEEADAAKRKAAAEAERTRAQREEFEAKERARQAETRSGMDTRKLAALGVGGLAVVGLGLGVTFGILSTGAKSSFLNAVTLDEKRAAEGRTRTFALVADISLAVALAAAITFAVLFPWSSLAGEPHASVQVALTPGGVALGGTF